MSMAGTKLFAVLVAALLLVQTAAAGVEVGDIPPSRLGTDQHGEGVRLAQMSGKVVVVTFWATWCPPCLEELPVLEAIHNSVGEDKLEVIAVNVEDRDIYRAARRVLKDYRMTLVNDHRGVIKRKFGVKGLPHMVIVGSDGRVSSVRTGYSEEQVVEVVDELNDLLRTQQMNTPAGSPPPASGAADSGADASR